MTTYSFKEFINSIIVENLHPELHSIVTDNKYSNASKQTRLAKKIKELSAAGKPTGVEGNMPKGSSRAYLQHSEPHATTVDGKPANLKTGTKVAITATLDKFHNKKEHDGHSLGQLQNHAEGGDHWVNRNYRILTKDDSNKNEFHSNKESGIFPPLIDHDHEHNNWTHVGHSRDIKAGEFQKLTKCDTHKKGITHKDFCDAMERHHNKNNGKHWGDPVKDAHLDEVDKHPLVQKFQDYHGNTGAPPHDYRQLKNMGVFEHPDGSHHIVARDHGYDSGVAKAYQGARRKQSDSIRGNRGY